MVVGHTPHKRLSYLIETLNDVVNAATRSAKMMLPPSSKDSRDFVDIDFT